MWQFGVCAQSKEGVGFGFFPSCSMTVGSSVVKSYSRETGLGECVHRSYIAAQVRGQPEAEIEPKLGFTSPGPGHMCWKVEAA